MKTHEIKTSKGEFVAVDMTTGVHRIKVFNDIDRPYISYLIGIDTYRLYVDEHIEFTCKLSEATEQDAKLIVDEKEMFSYGSEKKFVTVYEDYIDEILVHRNPIESIHSLLKSKGIDINNGNWYLFKKI